MGGSERLRGGCRWAGPGLAVTHGHAGAGDGPGEACPVPLCGLCRVFKIYTSNGRPLLYLHSTTSRISSQTVIRYHHTWCRVQKTACSDVFRVHHTTLYHGVLSRA